jgi:predicted methyltransferase
MIIILNNGTKIRVYDDFVQQVIKKILAGDAKNWQIQLDTQNTGLSGFNLSQVAAICKEEDIV